MKRAIKTALAVVAVCAAVIAAFAIGATHTLTTSQNIIDLNNVQGFSVDGDELHIYTTDGNEYVVIK